MGSASSTPLPTPPLSASTTTTEPQKEKLKICCACPETKKLRDECILLLGEQNIKCQELIEAHKICLRKHGFNV